MADYKHGSMDTKSQERAFAGFIRFGTWAAGIVIFLLVFMAIFTS